MKKHITRALFAILTALAVGVAGVANAFGPAKDFYFDASRGLVAGASTVVKFGINRDLDTGVTEDLWVFGGTRTTFTGDGAITCTAASGNDVTGGTGAREVTFDVIDTAGAADTWTGNIVAVLGVNSGMSTFQHINRAYVSSAGSLGTNDGDITCSLGGSTAVLIEAGQGQSQLTHYSVPDNVTAYVVGLEMAVGGAGAQKRVNVELMTRIDGVLRIKGEYYLDTNGTSVTPNIGNRVPIVLPGGTDIFLRATADDNNTAVYAQYSMILIKNGY